MSKILDVDFTSNWSCGLIESTAKLNLDTGEVFDIVTDEDATDEMDNDATLEEQTIFIKELNATFDVLEDELETPDGHAMEYAISAEYLDYIKKKLGDLEQDALGITGTSKSDLEP